MPMWLENLHIEWKWLDSSQVKLLEELRLWAKNDATQEQIKSAMDSLSSMIISSESGIVGDKISNILWIENEFSYRVNDILSASPNIRSRLLSESQSSFKPSNVVPFPNKRKTWWNDSLAA